MFVVFAVAFGQQTSKSEQPQIEESKPFISSQGNEIPENVVFERLFKSVNSLNREAEKQMEAGFPQRAYALQNHYKKSAQLDESQAQKLKDIAEAFQQEIDVIKKQKSKVAASLKEQPDNVKLLKRVDKFYKARGQLWLKYRDLLNEAFGLKKFQQFRLFLQEKFASKIKSNKAEIKKHPRFTFDKSLNSSSAMFSYSYSYSDVSYDVDTDVVFGSSATWIEGGGWFYPEFSNGGSCDPEDSYCWNVSLVAVMSEPDGDNPTPESGQGCDGYVEAYLYPNSETEEGEYYVGGEHAGQQNLGYNPYCGMQGADYYDYSSDSTTVSKPKVNILLNGSVITNTTRDVIVGQQISLSAQVTGGTPTTPQWTIPGTKVANYVVTYTDPSSPTSALVTELTNQNLTQPTINFYWVDGGDSRQVQYSVKVNNRIYTGRATFNVKRPTTQLTTTTGTVGLGTIQISDTGTTAFALHYGKPFGTTPGIFFSANAAIPSNFSGDIIWVQVVNSRRTRKPVKSNEQVLAGIGLDTEFPYGEPNSGDEADSPFEKLDSPRSYSSISVNDTFTMWLLFKPKNLPGTSIYVPLKKVNWSWSGTGTRSASGWILLNTANTQNPTGVDTVDFPEWIANISHFNYQ